MNIYTQNKAHILQFLFELKDDWLKNRLDEWSWMDVSEWIDTLNIPEDHRSKIVKELTEFEADGIILNCSESVDEFMSDLKLPESIRGSLKILFDSLKIHDKPFKIWSNDEIQSFLKSRKYLQKWMTNIIVNAINLNLTGMSFESKWTEKKLMDSFKITNKTMTQKLFMPPVFFRSLQQNWANFFLTPHMDFHSN